MVLAEGVESIEWMVKEMMVITLDLTARYRIGLCRS